MNNKLEQAIFAGGCFWCIAAAFDEFKGVKKVRSGYIGGDSKNPNYEQVSTGLTGHYEAIKITYNPKEVTFTELLDHYFKHIDPTDDGGQFVDRGSQYKTAIFYLNVKQQQSAENKLKELYNKFEQKVVTKILKASEFYDAEEYHQDYHKKKKEAYEIYKHASGRDEKLTNLWKDE